MKENNNLDNLIHNYYNKYDEFVKVPVNITYGIENIMYSEKNKRYSFIVLIKKIIITILGILTMSGGLVFAKEYLFKSFQIGKGIDTAIENGYIYQNIETITNREVEVKTQEFLMDDQNISTSFLLNFDNAIRERIEKNNIKRLKLTDLIITDENKNILYCANEKALGDFCIKNNLNYKFGEFNNNYFSAGLNNFSQINSDKNIILTYNIYSGGLENKYPKSKHLNYHFNTILLIDPVASEKNDTSNNIKIEGNWDFVIDVPEKMYNRKEIPYKVVSSSNQDIEITNAKLSETGFEFGAIIHNIELPQELKEYRECMRKRLNNEISQEEWEETYNRINNLDISLPPISSDYDTFLGETIEDCTYIENENGEKFLISSNVGRSQKRNFIDDVTLDFYDTFDLTKYNMTNKLTIHLVYYSKVNTIILEKN